MTIQINKRDNSLNYSPSCAMPWLSGIDSWLVPASERMPTTIYLYEIIVICDREPCMYNWFALRFVYNPSDVRTFKYNIM